MIESIQEPVETRQASVAVAAFQTAIRQQESFERTAEEQREKSQRVAESSREQRAQEEDKQQQQNEHEVDFVVGSSSGGAGSNDPLEQRGMAVDLSA